MAVLPGREVLSDSPTSTCLSVVAASTWAQAIGEYPYMTTCSDGGVT